MKLKKGTLALLTNLEFTIVILAIFIFHPDLLVTFGIPVLGMLLANTGYYIAMNVRDKKNTAINYVPALDPNNHIQTGTISISDNIPEEESCGK